MKIIVTTKIKSSALSSFLMVLLALIFILAGSGCEVNSEQQAKQKEAKSIIDQISMVYFNLASKGFRKLTLQCESVVMNSAISDIKDNVLRSQMEQSKIFIHWSKRAGFGIEITDLPELPMPEQDKRLKAFMIAVKDRMLGTFTALSPIFYGPIPSGEKKPIDFIKTQNEIILSYKGRGRNAIDKYYLDQEFNLYKAEQFQNSKLITTVAYSFVDKNEKKYLIKLVITNQSTNTQVELKVDYKDFGGESFPGRIAGSVIQNNHSMDDEITVLNVSSSS